MENQALWHERDISHSSVERMIMPDTTALMDYMLHRMSGVLERLVVKEDNIERNLMGSFGLFYSQRVLNKLIATGLKRQAAYEMVQKVAMCCWADRLQFEDEVRKDAEVNKHIESNDLDEAFDPSYYKRYEDVVFDRVFQGEIGMTELKRKLARLLLKLSYKEGDFTLTSGKKSDYYFDCKQTALHAEGGYLIGRLFVEMLKGYDVDGVGGMTLGADPLINRCDRGLPSGGKAAAGIHHPQEVQGPRHGPVPRRAGQFQGRRQGRAPGRRVYHGRHVDHGGPAGPGRGPQDCGCAGRSGSRGRRQGKAQGGGVGTRFHLHPSGIIGLRDNRQGSPGRRAAGFGVPMRGADSIFTMRFAVLFLTLIISAGTALADGWVPVLSSHAYGPERIIAVDKASQQLIMFERKSPLHEVYRFPCTTGQSAGDKLVEGDLRTPEGVYFVGHKIDRDLDWGLYGNIAYALNYPNPIDRIKGKTGGGIWLHGRGKTFVPRDTLGCVALKVPDMENVATEAPYGTPVVIGSGLEWMQEPGDNEVEALEVVGELTAWARDWQHMDEALFDHYDAALMTRSERTDFKGFIAKTNVIFSPTSRGFTSWWTMSGPSPGRATG